MTQQTLSLREATAKALCEKSHLFSTRYFFKARQNTKFKVNWHHVWIAEHLEKVIKGEITNLVINVPPGSSKTEMAVINLIARGIALNPWARFLHLSYSSDLALTNSKAARDLINSEEYQTLWPLAISDDSKAKQRWNVIVDGKEAGGVYATSLSGQVTGFRAGRMVPGFQGALIIDDPLKPEDAFSEPKLRRANRQLLTTVKSRKANPETPTIVIMQRIAEMDPTGFIKSGALPGKWVHLVIPALITEEYVATLPPHIQELVEREGPSRFSYWPYKEPTQELLSMERGESTDETGARMSRHVFAGQYMQNPVALGGNIIHGEHFVKYGAVQRPKIRYRKIYVDTAQKTKERNDYSVFECWGYGEDGKIYLLDLMRGKWEAPELERRALAFWAKHKALTSEFLGPLREMVVEDKASGTGLIQKLKAGDPAQGIAALPVVAIERTIDKLTRVMDVLGYIEAKMVCVPVEAPFTADFVQECEAFTADDSHAFDDQIDPLVDAVNDMLSSQNPMKIWEELGRQATNAV